MSPTSTYSLPVEPALEHVQKASSAGRRRSWHIVYTDFCGPRLDESTFSGIPHDLDEYEAQFSALNGIPRSPTLFPSDLEPQYVAVDYFDMDSQDLDSIFAALNGRADFPRNPSEGGLVDGALDDAFDNLAVASDDSMSDSEDEVPDHTVRSPPAPVKKRARQTRPKPAPPSRARPAPAPRKRRAPAASSVSAAPAASSSRAPRSSRLDTRTVGPTRRQPTTKPNVPRTDARVSSAPIKRNETSAVGATRSSSKRDVPRAVGPIRSIPIKRKEARAAASPMQPRPAPPKDHAFASAPIPYKAVAAAIANGSTLPPESITVPEGFHYLFHLGCRLAGGGGMVCNFERCTHRTVNFADMTRHVLTHYRDEVMFACSGCPITFSRADSKRRHLKSHKGCVKVDPARRALIPVFKALPHVKEFCEQLEAASSHRIVILSKQLCVPPASFISAGLTYRSPFFRESMWLSWVADRLKA
ncbi:hypothetical protein GGX14DRAFT_463590 [Mycena pura]|uniref:C2H2-type domain-containing protein n=1 Tax=Mycena pura TaxID=153505 RepID=A0AAD6V7N2_9AGAR|nr:hypothetical protein GGX14DRAFT_463590 [Mycena pura]